ncbi:hypothetical protein [Aquirufa nivalisilvae]
MSSKISHINSSNNKLDKWTTMGRTASGKSRQLKAHYVQIFNNPMLTNLMKKSKN